MVNNPGYMVWKVEIRYEDDMENMVQLGDTSAEYSPIHLLKEKHLRPHELFVLRSATLLINVQRLLLVQFEPSTLAAPVLHNDLV